MSVPVWPVFAATPALAEIEPAFWQSTLVRVLILAIVVPTGALVMAIGFLFKVMAWMQSRNGPMEAGLIKKTFKGPDGKRHTLHSGRGELQLIAELVKWLQKEDLIPGGADRFLFKLAPFIVLTSTFLLYAALPAGPGAAVAAMLPGGVFFILAVSSLSVIGILIAGWASNNKYALIGGVRAAGQLIAYELPMVLAVVGVVVLTGSMNLNDIVAAQANFKVGPVPIPFIIVQLPLFLVFLTAVQAELTQTPFDMPIAESELVAGHMVEYSGFRFLTYFLSEFSSAFAFAAITATLFLGGWYIPIGIPLDSGLWYVLGPLVLFAKIMIVAFVIFWVRFTYPRFREDQLQKLAWKYLIPTSLVWISLTAVMVVVR
jgi:NADH-quinone oxidoreductase subunit H